MLLFMKLIESGVKTLLDHRAPREGGRPAVRLADTGRRTVRSGAGARPAFRNSPACIRTGLLASACGGKPGDVRCSRAADLQSARHDLPPLPRGWREIGGSAPI